MTMTTTPEAVIGDHRGSWIPTWAMITTRIMELRKRRGLMIALIAVTLDFRRVLLIRLISHPVDLSPTDRRAATTSSRR